MKVRLLFQTDDPSWKETPNPLWDQRFADLELDRILDAMSGDDPTIRQVCRHLLDAPLLEPDTILYRQNILQDCLAKPNTIRRLYQICQQADQKRNGSWYRLTSPYLSSVYSSASDLLKIYMEALVEIRKTLEQEAFSSAGLRQFSAMLCQELSDDYLEQVRSVRSAIHDDSEILISAGFGSFLQGVSYVERQKKGGLSKLQWLLYPSYTLDERDTTGEKDFRCRRDRAINEVTCAMAQAAESLETFTKQLTKQLAFYIGALNLHDSLTQLQRPLCFPVPAEQGKRSWQNLYDGSLALLTHGHVVGNTILSEGKNLYLITGANQGGKTTFLRSVGQCQLMAQCGLFVCAEACQFPAKKQLYTHFKREEDKALHSGKLDEELERMSRIVDNLHPGGMLLSNESFSSTNDWEGSEIFVQITRALLESGVEIFSVTHLINYAMTLAQREDALCLRAQRKDNGDRTFQLCLGKPLKTAFGEDLYRKIFSEDSE